MIRGKAENENPKRVFYKCPGIIYAYFVINDNHNSIFVIIIFIFINQILTIQQNSHKNILPLKCYNPEPKLSLLFLNISLSM